MLLHKKIVCIFFNSDITSYGEGGNYCNLDHQVYISYFGHQCLLHKAKVKRYSNNLTSYEMEEIVLLTFLDALSSNFWFRKFFPFLMYVFNCEFLNLIESEYKFLFAQT